MADLGAHALRFALAIAVFGLGAGVYAGRARRADWTRVAERALGLVFACTTLAIGLLFYAFGSCDYSLQYVASNSARSMALPYRLAALWGGQAGSLLLWAWILSGYAFLVVTQNRRHNRDLMPGVTATLMSILTFFLVLLEIGRASCRERVCQYV